MQRFTKLKNDLYFINPETKEVCCTYNECKNKFTKRVVIRDTIPFTILYACSECGRKMKFTGSDIEKESEQLTYKEKPQEFTEYKKNERIEKIEKREKRNLLNKVIKRPYRESSKLKQMKKDFRESRQK